MKYILLSTLILCSQLGNSQQKRAGYGYIAFDGFVSKSFENTYGANLGVGFGETVTVGAALGVFVFQKSNLEFGTISADFRVFFKGLDKPGSPFITFQPGWVLYNNSFGTGSNRVNTKGSFAINAMAGMYVKPIKNLGLVCSAGYSNISFKTESEIIRHGGFKFNIGLFF